MADCCARALGRKMVDVILDQNEALSDVMRDLTLVMKLNPNGIVRADKAVGGTHFSHAW